jgi:hypothetical protein
VSHTPSPTELIKVRSAWDDWLLDVASIEREVTSQGDYGEETTPEIIASGIPCGVNSTLLPGVQQLIADQLSAVADAAVSFPYGTDVQVADVVIITSQFDRRFEVLYVTAPSAVDAGVQTYTREVR